VLLLVGAGACLWRYLHPEILAQFPAGPSLIYLGLLCTLIPLVSVIGACGAELTFPANRE
jgi:hypothetical protein